MGRSSFLLFVFFFFLACTQAQAEAEGIQEIDVFPPVTFKVNAKTVNFNSEERQKVEAAASLIKKIVESPEFRKKILNYTYLGRKQFNDNKGLSNEEIYIKILEGSEKMTGLGKNKTMDLELELYTDMNSRTIGYTYPNIVRVFVNNKYFSRFKPHQVADKMMHEWLHKIGFDHSIEATTDRAHSVPYAVGYIVRRLALKLSSH